MDVSLMSSDHLGECNCIQKARVHQRPGANDRDRGQFAGALREGQAAFLARPSDNLAPNLKHGRRAASKLAPMRRHLQFQPDHATCQRSPTRRYLRQPAASSHSCSYVPRGTNGMASGWDGARSGLKVSLPRDLNARRGGCREPGVLDCDSRTRNDGLAVRDCRTRAGSSGVRYAVGVE